jgi:cytoskeletal protein RodZ
VLFVLFCLLVFNFFVFGFMILQYLEDGWCTHYYSLLFQFKQQARKMNSENIKDDAEAEVTVSVPKKRRQRSLFVKGDSDDGDADKILVDVPTPTPTPYQHETIVISEDEVDDTEMKQTMASTTASTKVVKTKATNAKAVSTKPKAKAGSQSGEAISSSLIAEFSQLDHVKLFDDIETAHIFRPTR